MGLYLDEGHTVIVENGVVCAVKQGGKVEVWDADGETHYGNLPETATPDDVQTAFGFYENGRIAGESYGRANLQSQLKNLLGV